MEIKETNELGKPFKKIHCTDITDLGELRTLTIKELQYTKNTLDETIIGHRKFLNKLTKICVKIANDEPITAIEQSMMNTWQEFYKLFETQEMVFTSLNGYITKCMDLQLTKQDIDEKNAKINKAIKDDLSNNSKKDDQQVNASENNAGKGANGSDSNNKN